MTEKQIEDNFESYDGSEFLVCGAIGADETKKNHELQVYIVPKLYFEKHNEIYPYSLCINHILPNYMKEVSPGLYSTKSVDYPTLMFELCNTRGFQEDFDLQLHANTL